MVSEKVTVINKAGFHMRPASLFVQAMAKYKSAINIVYNGKNIDGKSIMNEQALLAEAAGLVKSGLGEA